MPACRWLAGGGWWAVAHTLAYAVSLSAVVLSADRHPALHNQLRQHYFFTPVPLFVARWVGGLLAGGGRMLLCLVAAHD